MTITSKMEFMYFVITDWTQTSLIHNNIIFSHQITAYSLKYWCFWGDKIQIRFT